MKIKPFSFAIFTVLSFAFTCSATTHYVDANGSNPTVRYLDWTTAATNIQDAIDASVAGDLVMVTSGVYAMGGSVIHGVVTNCVNKAITVTGSSTVL